MLGGENIIAGGMVEKPGTILGKNGQNRRFKVFLGGGGGGFVKKISGLEFSSRANK